MGRCYILFRRLARHWFLGVVLMVGAAVVLGLYGFTQENPENDFATNAYLVALLFALNCGDAAKPVGWEVNVARWLGFAVWFVTVVSILVRLFGQRVLSGYVGLWAWWRPGHVVVGGLGRPDLDLDRLVEELRAAGRDVVVVEPDPEHPGLDACRQAGAVCLTGSPLEQFNLRKARVHRAGTLLALGGDDRANVSVMCLAADVRAAKKVAPSPPPPDPLSPPAGRGLDCIVQVSEPRLLDLLRRQDAGPAAVGRVNVRPFNVHELVARAMLRECLIRLSSPVVDSILILGTGAGGRIARAVAVRAAKDRWIDRDPNAPFRPLRADVYDPDAVAWGECLASSLDPAVAALMEVRPHPCESHRCGFRNGTVRDRVLGGAYHAAFVGMSDEAHALIQALALREAMPTTVPVVVRVREEGAGFGGLVVTPQGDPFADNLHTIGTQDQVFALAGSLNPMVEVFARALHQDYLLLTDRKYHDAMRRGNLELAKKIRAKEAFKRWGKLHPNFRRSNHLLAGRLSRYLFVPSTNRRFRAVYRPNALIDASRAYLLTTDEVEELARLEHAGWLEDMAADGWTFGRGSAPDGSDPVRKLNQNMVPWGKLDTGTQDYDRNIIRRLPFVFAKADYELVEV